MKTCKFLLLMVCLLFWGAAFARDASQRSVVLLHVAKQSVDFESPWMNAPTSEQNFMAVKVGENRFLTTAQAVADAKNIGLQSFEFPKRLPAEVAFVDYEANLALVKLIDKAGLADIPKVAFGLDEVSVPKPVLVLKNHESREVISRRGLLRRVSLSAGKTSPYPFPFYEIEVTDLNGFGWAEPVFDQGRMIGISTEAGKVIKALPLSVIRHFLQDAMSLSYRGFPFIGISTSALLSDFNRRRLQATSVVGGVVIGSVFESSPFKGSLQKDDVVYRIDGKPLDSYGQYEHPLWGKVFMTYVVCQKFAGDELKVDFLRNGKPMSVTKNMKRFDRNRTRLAYFRASQAEDHIIFGGVVLQELSLQYLQTWGKDWESKAPDRLLYHWFYKNDPPAEAGDRMIVLNRVLADRFNQGYEDIKNAVLETVNGVAVSNLDQIRKILKEAPIVRAGKKYGVLSFKYGVADIVLPYEGLAEADKRIRDSYGIPQTSALF